jgi:probable rRNA maturation factor
VDIELIYETKLFKLSNETKCRKWLIEIAKKEKKVIEKIKIVFVTDTKIIEINKKFLKHDYYTDVISFNNSFLNFISGEIYISVPTVIKNSKIYSNGILEDEINRVLVHGLLHLIGYNDKNNDEILIMRSKEDSYLMYLD